MSAGFQGINIQPDPVPPTQWPRIPSTNLSGGQNRAGWTAAPGQGLRPIRLPERVGAWCILGPGRSRPSAVRVLGVALDLLQRMCPWGTMHAVPAVWSLSDDGDTDYLAVRPSDGGRLWGLVGGLAYPDDGVIAVSLWASGAGVLSTVCHEAWHVVSPHIRTDLLKELDVALSGAVEIGTDSYWADPEERRARAFQHWCSAFLNGCPARRADGFVDELFDHVWCGGFGTEVVRKGLVAA